jgi:hypothetical protein
VSEETSGAVTSLGEFSATTRVGVSDPDCPTLDVSASTAVVASDLDRSKIGATSNITRDDHASVEPNRLNSKVLL